MVAASLLYLLRSEKTATAAGIGGEQAWATAMSGVQQAMYVAAQSGSEAITWQDNPGVFKNQLVLDDGVNQWYFSVYSVSDQTSSETRFGLTDEASKINLHHADAGTLERLPNLTPALAQSMVDFVHGSGVLLPASTNAAIELIAALAAPAPAAGVACLDELLHLPGFTSALLYGEDANLNGNLDPNEDDGEASGPPDNQDAQLDLGLRVLLTLSSYDLNLDNQGQPRLNLNDSTSDLSGLDLPESVMTYVQTLRSQGKTVAHPAELLEASIKLKDAKGAETNLLSEVGKAELPILLDRCTGTNQAKLVGLVNLNTASAGVLAALPGSDSSLADAIISARVGLTEDARQSTAWLYQEGIVNADLFKKLAPHITTRSSQFHFHVLAYAVPAGTYRVLEAVIDTAAQPPAILLLRDLTRFGLPYGAAPLKEPVRQAPGAAQNAPQTAPKIPWDSPNRLTVGRRVPPHPDPFPQGAGKRPPALLPATRARFVKGRLTVLALPKGEGRGEGEGNVFNPAACSANQQRASSSSSVLTQFSRARTTARTSPSRSRRLSGNFPVRENPDGMGSARASRAVVGVLADHTSVLDQVCFLLGAPNYALEEPSRSCQPRGKQESLVHATLTAENTHG